MGSLALARQAVSKNRLASWNTLISKPVF